MARQNRQMTGFFLEPKYKRLLAADAKRAGMSVSSYIRYIVMRWYSIPQGDVIVRPVTAAEGDNAQGR